MNKAHFVKEVEGGYRCQRVGAQGRLNTQLEEPLNIRQLPVQHPVGPRAQADVSAGLSECFHFLEVEFQKMHGQGILIQQSPMKGHLNGPFSKTVPPGKIDSHVGHEIGPGPLSGLKEFRFGPGFSQVKAESLSQMGIRRLNPLEQAGAGGVGCVSPVGMADGPGVFRKQGEVPVIAEAFKPDRCLYAQDFQRHGHRNVRAELTCQARARVFEGCCTFLNRPYGFFRALAVAFGDQCLDPRDESPGGMGPGAAGKRHMGVGVHQGRHENTVSMIDDLAVIVGCGADSTDFQNSVFPDHDAAVFNPVSRFGHDPARPVNDGGHGAAFTPFSTGLYKVFL